MVLLFGIGKAGPEGSGGAEKPVDVQPVIGFEIGGTVAVDLDVG